MYIGRWSLVKDPLLMTDVVLVEVEVDASEADVDAQSVIILSE